MVVGDESALGQAEREHVSWRRMSEGPRPASLGVDLNDRRYWINPRRYTLLGRRCRVNLEDLLRRKRTPTGRVIDSDRRASYNEPSFAYTRASIVRKFSAKTLADKATRQRRQENEQTTLFFVKFRW